MTSSISLKAHCGNSIKRQLINNPQLTYNELCFTLHRMFQPLLSNNLENLILRYVDQDGDFICLETDDDLLTALASSSSLHIHVFDKETVPLKDGSIQQLDLRHLSLSEKNMQSLIFYLTHVQEKVQALIHALLTLQTKNKNLKSLTETDISILLNQLEITPPSTSTNSSTPSANSMVPTQSANPNPTETKTENTDSLLHSTPVPVYLLPTQQHKQQQQQQQQEQNIGNAAQPPAPSSTPSTSYSTTANPPPSTAMYTHHTSSSQSYHPPPHYNTHPSMMTQQQPQPPLQTSSTPQPYTHPQSYPTHHPHPYTPRPMYLTSIAPSTSTPEHPAYALGAYRPHTTPSYTDYASSSSSPSSSSTSSSSSSTPASSSTISVTNNPNASYLPKTNPPTPSPSMAPSTSLPQGAYNPYYSTSNYRKY